MFIKEIHYVVLVNVREIIHEQGIDHIVWV